MQITSRGEYFIWLLAAYSQLLLTAFLCKWFSFSLSRASFSYFGFCCKYLCVLLAKTVVGGTRGEKCSESDRLAIRSSLNGWIDLLVLDLEAKLIQVNCGLASFYIWSPPGSSSLHIDVIYAHNTSRRAKCFRIKINLSQKFSWMKRLKFLYQLAKLKHRLVRTLARPFNYVN